MATRTEIRVHEQLIRILQLMQRRMSWTAGSKFLEISKVHQSRGWLETIANITARPPNLEVMGSAVGQLTEAYDWHTLVGEKEVTWFALSALKSSDANQVRRWARDADEAQLMSAYGNPEFSIGQTPIASMQLKRSASAHQLVSIHREGQRLVFRYFTSRSYIIREEIDLTQLDEDRRAALKRFDSVIGIKTEWMPCFDVVVVDLAQDRIEIRVDAAMSGRNDAQSLAAARVLEHFNALVFREITLQPGGLGLINFYRAVSNFYGDSAAGRVSMLGFVATSTDTSSNNKGQILRKPDQDLRKDRFHVGGAKSVQSITPYTIGVTWEAPSKIQRITLELPGSVRLVYAVGMKQIDRAIFNGCITREDYDLLSAQLLAHL